jgi:replicative DNA helicase
LPNVRTGQQHIFAARPGKGKTSFCAAQAVCFARQIPDDRPIVWFNNEGKGRVIKGTTYRAALHLDFNGIIDLGAANAAKQFSEVCGGPDRIRIFDVHGRDYRYLERIIDAHRPSVVFFDMLDNVKGFGDAARDDLRLESLYQWSRESAVIYDFLSIPTKQVSVEGDAIPWIPASALKDSKTGVQGACDSIITMGYKGGKQWLDSRFLFVPKTKQSPEKGYRADCAVEIRFNGGKCQFIETLPTDTSQEDPNV